MNRNQIIAALSSVCLLPSIILTVAPTFMHDPGIAVCMLLGIIFLPLTTFAVRRAEGTVAKALFIVLGMVLFLYNYSNALRAINHGYAADTSVARVRIASAANLQARLTDLGSRKREIPAHAIVSKGALAAAQAARDAECGTGYATRCRGREDALAAAQRDYAITERAAVVEANLDQTKRDVEALGPVETTADPTAAQVASIVGLFWTKAAAPGAAEGISTHFPAFIAFVVELTGGLMPLALVTLFGAPRPRTARVNFGDRDTVPAWHAECIERRPGKRLRAKKAFESYRSWCRQNKHDPVSLRSFGDVLRDQIKVKKQTTRGYTYYLDLGLSDAWDFLTEELTEGQREAARRAPPKLTVVPTTPAIDGEGRQSAEGDGRQSRGSG
jgi:hypothetical protein